MGIDAAGSIFRRAGSMFMAAIVAGCLAGCGTAPLVGIVYTNVKLPLTQDLDATLLPAHPPGSDRIIEVKEPFSGLGIYARVNSNALGDIAREHGIDPLYFADREVFSILGIWKANRVFLYGASAGGREPGERRTKNP